MKDNISIIFTAIIGTFLIVLLPLYSILDRQDSMSYNVVLTATTNFVDNIRNNGFVDRESYYNYISALASTANTYKVTLEAYRKTLIKETDENGNVIPNSFVEEIELYNTQDILSILEGEMDVNTDKSNVKNNVYLFDVNDEIYVKVHNTNMTAGSVIYNVVAGVTNKEVINVSYGGVVNKINWELYDKIQAETDLAPEVVMSVPVNGANSTNIIKLGQDEALERIDCTVEDLDDNIGVSLEELCGDVVDSNSLGSYTYYYDLSKEINRTIKVAVELRGLDKIDVGSESNGQYIPITDLTESDFNNDEDGRKSQRELNIIRNYIQLNGMYANIDLQLRKSKEYYVFDIILTNVRMSALDYISSFASITILPGLGMDENGILSLGAETVQIELRDETAVNTVRISQPHNWKQFLKTKDVSKSIISSNTIYANQEIFFVITYTGINDHSDDDIITAIRNNLKVYINDAEYSDMQIHTVDSLNQTYGTNEEEGVVGRAFVKFTYDKPNNSKNNYIELLEGWIATNIDEYIEYGEEFAIYAHGAKSSEYSVLLDDIGPIEPDILLEGIEGNNGWYTTDVTLNLIPPSSDQVRKTIENEGVIENSIELDGSGVYINSVIVNGANTHEVQDVEKIQLTNEGKSYAIAKSYDYIGNVTQTEPLEIKIDKTAPTAPKISVSGDEGENGWYKSDIVVQITPGTDDMSGVAVTKYRIEGANELVETEGTKYTLTEQGTSTFIATTWDNAGNKTETKVNIYIDKSTPPDAKIEVIEGQKNSPSTDWYYTDVKIRITVDAPESVSGLGTSSYEIKGDSNVKATTFVGNAHEITLTENGIHEIIVTTSTVAGNTKETKYTVMIDKSAPNEPTVDLKGTAGENNWYTSNVEVSVVPNGDIGNSGQKTTTYKIIKNGIEPNFETEISGDNKIVLSDEGEFRLIVYSRDKAFNKIQSEHVIKIDKTPPIPAEFVVIGTLGKDSWYTSDVSLSYEKDSDGISGIQNVVLSQESITENTLGTTVTLTTKDNAGHVVTKEQVIKIDKYAPSKPTISIKDEPTGTGIFGTLLFNKDVEVTIVPGVEDSTILNNNNLDKTTYRITRNNGEVVEELITETVINEGITFKSEWEGVITIEATTWDIAGNSSTETTILWIDKAKPEIPTIVSINGTNVEGILNKTINSENNTISLEIDNLYENNIVTITLINKVTHEKIVKEITYAEDMVIPVELTAKGAYSIQVTQTNMFGTVSDVSTGLYTYIYE